MLYDIIPWEYCRDNSSMHSVEYRRRKMYSAKRRECELSKYVWETELTAHQEMSKRSELKSLQDIDISRLSDAKYRVAVKYYLHKHISSMMNRVHINVYSRLRIENFQEVLQLVNCKYINMTTGLRWLVANQCELGDNMLELIQLSLVDSLIVQGTNSNTLQDSYIISELYSELKWLMGTVTRCVPYEGYKIRLLQNLRLVYNGRFRDCCSLMTRTLKDFKRIEAEIQCSYQLEYQRHVNKLSNLTERLNQSVEQHDTFESMRLHEVKLGEYRFKDKGRLQFDSHVETICKLAEVWVSRCEYYKKDFKEYFHDLHLFDDEF